MDQVNELIAYFMDNPAMAALAGLGAGGLVYFLFRKPKTVREADAQLKRMRGERAGYYDQFRPPH